MAIIWQAERVTKLLFARVQVYCPCLWVKAWQSYLDNTGRRVIIVIAAFIMSLLKML